MEVKSSGKRNVILRYGYGYIIKVSYSLDFTIKSDELLKRHFLHAARYHPTLRIFLYCS